MADATRRSNGQLITITAAGNIAEGQLIQLADGRAAYAPTAITAGDSGQVRVSGVARVTKATGIVLLEGDEAFWDYSADNATYKTVNDRDFFAGCVVEGDTTSTQTFVDIALNERAKWLIDVARDAFLSVPVGTQGLNTMGVFRRGGSHTMVLSATNEAQKLDILSVDGFSKDANAIIEFVFTVPSDGAGTVVDVSLGAANATHATDADSITESIFAHLNANDLNIYLESDDGTTEIAATDSTIDYTEGAAVANRVYVTMDMRNPADVQIYINRVLALGSTIFNVNAAALPFFLLAHIEKTASTDTYELSLHSMKCRIGGE